MTLVTISVARAAGKRVEGEALVSTHGFSPRYDLDRLTGRITRDGHDLEGATITDKICFFAAAKGGVAAGWAYHDLACKGLAPRALVFGVTNPVMVQGAIFAAIPLTEGWTPAPYGLIATGDWVLVDPSRAVIELLRRKGQHGDRSA